MVRLQNGVARLRTLASGTQLPSGMLQRLAPLLLLVIVLTCLALMLLWRDDSSYKPVFGARENVAVSDMMAALDADRIPYRVHPDSGQVLVPENELGRARMLLAAKGVIARLPAGLELMDRNDPLGVSQFVQDVRFRRGLEGELAQSIATIDAIASARVHLSIARSTSFVMSDGSKSSGSVMVVLKPGRELDGGQIAAIVNLVAGSVSDLAPERISLVDQTGALLSARIELAEGGLGVSSDADNTKRFREEARRSVRDLLAPVLGEENFKFSVTADVDNDRIQETREAYGDVPRLTNEALREETDREPLALGIPGSLSNRPVRPAPTPPPAPPQGAATPLDAASATKNATMRQFSYDRTVTQTQRGRGRLRKLHVAVVLNNAVAPDGASGWSEKSIAGIERMLRSGLGIDDGRGDTLTVSALSFPVRPVPGPWWQEPDRQIEMGIWALQAFGVLLAYLMVFRPVMRMLRQRWTPPVPATALPLEAQAVPALAGAALPSLAPPAEPDDATVAPLLDHYDLPPPGSAVDVLVEHLRNLAGKEPERVAEVVKQWVQKNGRAE